MTLFSLLPEDIFALLCKSLTPKDACSLSLCCRSLCALVDSEKLWATQCESLGVVGRKDLIEWRNGVSSFRSLCKFLYKVKPLLGIWVHQNPELGNVVYVMPGFVSVVGCRVIPQELGALGIQHGPLLWAPVFEIVGDGDGSLILFLHGREGDCNHLYPARLKSVDRSCNILLLEVEPGRGGNSSNNSFVHCNSDVGFARRVDKRMIRSQRVPEKNSVISFRNLGFGDRRKLLELVADHVRLKSSNLANGLLFPPLRVEDYNEGVRKDVLHLEKRRAMLIKIYNFGEGCANPRGLHRLPSNATEMEISKVKKSFDRPGSCHTLVEGNDGRSCRSRRQTFAAYFKDRVKLMLGRSASVTGSREGLRCASSKENKHSKFKEFVCSADTMGITLCAKSIRLLTYRAWPNMHDNQFALYKLSTPLPVAGQEYAGLWGGTFGWPPGIPTGDKPGKALFFLSLSYEESKGQTLLIATKILEGTHYVLHPNGSAMFEVKVDEMSYEPFPWNTDGVSLSMEVKHAFNGDGIANGYGFRYPGSKPGTLFVIEGGLLAFVWKESRAVLTMQRLNLQELLKKGERVSALPPIVNFAYLTKSYSNVFTGFSNTTR